MKSERCRLPGGKSTGPRTPERLARSRRAVLGTWLFFRGCNRHTTRGACEPKGSARANCLRRSMKGRAFGFGDLRMLSSRVFFAAEPGSLPAPRHARLLESGPTVQPTIYSNRLVSSLSVVVTNNAFASAQGPLKRSSYQPHRDPGRQLTRPLGGSTAEARPTARDTLRLCHNELS
jgi:hypothetical protein